MGKKRLSAPVRRMPWAGHHFKEGSNGYDRGCSECAADAEWTIDWEYADTGQPWRGAVSAAPRPGPLST